MEGGDGSSDEAGQSLAGSMMDEEHQNPHAEVNECGICSGPAYKEDCGHCGGEGYTESAVTTTIEDMSTAKWTCSWCDGDGWLWVCPKGCA